MILDLDDLEFDVNSNLRGIPFRAVYLDRKTPAVNQSFMGSDLMIGLGFVELAFLGAVFEIGDGWYRYSPDNSEVDVVGFISVRLHRVDLYPFMTTASVLLLAGSETVLPGSATQLPKSAMFGMGWLRI